MMNFFDLLQQLAIFLLLAYLFSKSPAFKPLASYILPLTHKLLLFGIFCGFTILGVAIGLPMPVKLLNTTAIGGTIAGLLGGPLLGCAVGGSAGLYALLSNGWSSLTLAHGLAAIFQGLIGGLIHLFLQRRSQSEQWFSPGLALLTATAGALLQTILLLLLPPLADTWGQIRLVILPMALVNGLGAGLFMSMMHDQKIMLDQVGAMFSTKALNIAERSLGILSQGFNAKTARQLVEIIYDETGVGAVGISDRERVMAFVGIGDDHHLAGLEIKSPQTREAIRTNKVLYADGIKERFTCALSNDCPLGSALIIPLRVDTEVVGTIKLYEPKNKLFLTLNKALGEGLAKLLSEQLLRDRYEAQKNLLVTSELKLIQAQVNPHFLFNALNTIVSVVRQDPGQARDLLLHLSNFFRKNLKRSSDLATLEEELDHVNSYLFIQKARFGAKLSVEQEIDSQLLTMKLPTFTLQPIVENAIKHGISNMLENGRVRITAHCDGERMRIEVIDDAGSYRENQSSDGLGMNIVDRRIKNLYGNQYGTEVSCIPDEQTRVSLILPCKPGETP